MRELPILFSTQMVQAILAGRKTMTRRVIKPQPKTDGLAGVYADLYNHDPNQWAFWLPDNRMTEPRTWKPHYQVGDRLWVKETWHQNTGLSADKTIHYRADGEQPYCWHPSIFMPKSAARIWLEVTANRAERLQDISEEDAKMEGLEVGGWNEDGSLCNATNHMELYWDFLNGKTYPWASNPWVWPISFKMVSK